MTPLDYALDEATLVEAGRAHNLTKWPRFVVIYAVGAVLFGTVLSLISDDRSLRGASEAAAMMLGVVLATCAVLILLTRYWTIPRSVRRTLRHFDDECLKQRVSWDNDGVRIDSSDGHSSWKFSQLAGWRRVNRHILLYRTDNLYVLLPGTALTDDAIRDDLFEKLAAHRVVAK